MSITGCRSPLRRSNEALYVALDSAVRPAEIVLTERLSDRVSYLEESRWQISELVREGCRWKMRATGFGSSEMVWRLQPAASYRVRVSRNGQPLWRGEVAPDANGRTVLNAPVDARDPLEITISCR